MRKIWKSFWEGFGDVMSVVMTFRGHELFFGFGVALAFLVVGVAIGGSLFGIAYLVSLLVL